MTKALEIEADINRLVRELNEAVKDTPITLAEAKLLYASLTQDIGWLRGVRDLLRTDNINGQHQKEDKEGGRDETQ
jgi:hypothetical protein